MQASIHTPSAEGVFSAVCSGEVARLHSQPISISLWLHFLLFLTAISVIRGSSLVLQKVLEGLCVNLWKYEGEGC